MNICENILNRIEYLNECTKAYDLGNPKITDEEWDKLYFELKNLEESTGLVFSHSPTQSINYQVVNQLNKVEHNHPMLSLDKTKSLKEVINFFDRRSMVLAMCKMDGLTCSLTYKNGELVAAETRGNGIVGEDILHNAKVIPSIPLKIPFLDTLTIDGEIICTYTDFDKFSNDYKNPRNFAAGSIRLLSARECATRSLKFVAWEVISELYNEDGFEYRLDQKLEMIRDYGFIIVPYTSFMITLLTEDHMHNYVDEIKEKAEKYGYPLDGAVFKYADCALGRSLGATAHHPRNAIAYKFYDEVYPTVLTGIEWTMGRTGTLTPVATFETIDIDGSEVSRASLHNISVMEDLLGATPYIGQKIEVYKANMIIPQIYSADKNVPDLATLHIIPPVCPVCGGMVKIKQDIDSKSLVCINTLCEGKLINRLDHFCGKKGLDIKGISKATLEKLINWGWVDNYTDIFNLEVHKDEWIKKPGFGVKSVEKVLNSIKEGANCELHQFIAALGIPLIGSTASKELVKIFPTWAEFIQAIEGKFNFFTLNGFGAEMHHSLTKFNYNEANYIANHYIQFKIPEITEAESGADLTGKVFVITGKLTHFKNRDEIKSRIEALGGKVTGSVSKNTHYLINNDVNSTSSKNMTAKSLGIPILSEEDFIETFGIT